MEEAVEAILVPTSTFISDIGDIDDLLMKGSHFVALDSSPVFFNDEESSTPKTLSGDFTNAKPIADILNVRTDIIESICVSQLIRSVTKNCFEAKNILLHCTALHLSIDVFVTLVKVQVFVNTSNSLDKFGHAQMQGALFTGWVQSVYPR